MNVQELIDELEKIEDKTLPVFKEDDDPFCGGPVIGVDVTSVNAFGNPCEKQVVLQ